MHLTVCLRYRIIIYSPYLFCTHLIGIFSRSVFFFLENKIVYNVERVRFHTHHPFSKKIYVLRRLMFVQTGIGRYTCKIEYISINLLNKRLVYNRSCSEHNLIGTSFGSFFYIVLAIPNRWSCGSNNVARCNLIDTSNYRNNSVCCSYFGTHSNSMTHPIIYCNNSVA